MIISIVQETLRVAAHDTTVRILHDTLSTVVVKSHCTADPHGFDWASFWGGVLSVIGGVLTAFASVKLSERSSGKAADALMRHRVAMIASDIGTSAIVISQRMMEAKVVSDELWQQLDGGIAEAREIIRNVPDLQRRVHQETVMRWQANMSTLPAALRAFDYAKTSVANLEERLSTTQTPIEDAEALAKFKAEEEMFGNAISHAIQVTQSLGFMPALADTAKGTMAVTEPGLGYPGPKELRYRARDWWHDRLYDVQRRWTGLLRWCKRVLR